MKRLVAQYSQHFLRSPRLVKELVGHSTISKHDTVYDIGAGSGVITSVLATRAGKVVAVEYEPQTAKKLQANMRHYDNVTVLQDDFLTMPLPDGPYKIFANIPFHLSSPIVRKLTEAEHSPEAIYLIVQKQFGQKLVPDTDRFTGQLGVMIGPLYTARIRKRLQKTDFMPSPAVDTVMLELLKRPEPLVSLADMPRYRSFVEACFSTPAKFAKTPRAAIGLPPDIKPSQVRIAQWVALFTAVTRR
jgi:16S rRNA A1518/A1519 N6-dimethyltransferase RsmA/KsgA/DIM1 with predicted DNA glycosylase/AP lyase activity